MGKQSHSNVVQYGAIVPLQEEAPNISCAPPAEDLRRDMEDDVRVRVHEDRWDFALKGG